MPTCRDSLPEQDASLAATKNKVSQISQVTWVGVALNITLTIIKAVGGIMAGSRALMADAVHSLSDLATDGAILVGVRYWTAPADEYHPYGHQKIETLVSMTIGLALGGLALALGYEASAHFITTLMSPTELEAHRTIASTSVAMGAALVSIISKELLYHWTVAKGRKLESPALVANAWHHRSDAFSSIPPLIAIGGESLGAKLGYNLWYLDPLGTLVVCVLLLHAAWEILKPALSTLVDTGADQILCQAILEAVLTTPGIQATHKIRTRYIGPGEVAVDLHILVNGTMSVAKGHNLAGEVKRKILSLRIPETNARAVDVVVHVEPHAEGTAR